MWIDSFSVCLRALPLVHVFIRYLFTRILSPVHCLPRFAVWLIAGKALPVYRDSFSTAFGFRVHCCTNLHNLRSVACPYYWRRILSEPTAKDYTQSRTSVHMPDLLKPGQVSAVEWSVNFEQLYGNPTTSERLQTTELCLNATPLNPWGANLNSLLCAGCLWNFVSNQKPQKVIPPAKLGWLFLWIVSALTCNQTWLEQKWTNHLSFAPFLWASTTESMYPFWFQHIPILWSLRKL